MFNRYLLISLTLLVFCLSQNLLACPKIGSFSLPDFNCDQEIQYTFTGDSIAKGVGDKNGKGGYVKRVKQFFAEKDVQIINLGVSGITTGRLFSEFKKNLGKSKAGKTQEAIFGADVIVIDAARNDYWQNRLTQSDDARAAKAVRNLKRVFKLLKQKTKANGKEAFVLFATMLPTTRSFQSGFLNLVNKKMLKAKGKNFPVLLRFDKFNTKFLRDDGLHPSPKGYDKIAENKIIPFLEGKLVTQVDKQRPDGDADGIYDQFEEPNFGTDSSLPDTDGDGVIDGTEVFDNSTDPLDSSSL